MATNIFRQNNGLKITGVPEKPLDDIDGYTATYTLEGNRLLTGMSSLEGTYQGGAYFYYNPLFGDESEKLKTASWEKTLTFSAAVTLAGGTEIKFNGGAFKSIFSVGNIIAGGDDSTLKLKDFVGNVPMPEGGSEDTIIGLAAITMSNTGVNFTKPQTFRQEFDTENLQITGVHIPWNKDAPIPTNVTAVIKRGMNEELVTINNISLDGIRQQPSSADDGRYCGYFLTLEDLGYSNKDGDSFVSIQADIGSIASQGIWNEFHVNSGSYAWTHSGSSVVYGRFRPSKTQGTVTGYLWPTEKGEAGKDEAKQATTTITRTLQRTIGVSTVANSGATAFDGNPLPAGSTVKMDYNMAYQYVTGGRRLDNPVFYLAEPEGTQINWNTLRLYDIGGNIDTGARNQELPWSYDKVDNLSTDSVNLYQVTLPKGYFLGGYDSDWNYGALRISYDINVLETAKTTTLNRATLLFLTNEQKVTSLSNGSTPVTDVYGITGNTKNLIVGLPAGTLSISGSTSIAMSGGAKMDTDADYFIYTPGDESSMVTFVPGAGGSIRFQVVNNGTNKAEKVTVYVPLPKQGLDLPQTFGGKTCNFDVTLGEGGVKSTDISPRVEYANVTSFNTDGKPGEGTMWSSSPTGANMIRLTYTDFPAGGSSTVTIDIASTDNADLSGAQNIFCPFAELEMGPYHSSISQGMIGMQLWTGKLSGTVFDDTDRDGIQDAKESGVANIPVRMTDPTGKATTTTTDEDGAYRFEGVVTNGEVKVEVLMGSRFSTSSNNGADARNFSTPLGTGSGVRSVVTPSVSDPGVGEYTYNGNENRDMTVSAGLVKPYEITLSASNASLSTTKAYRFAGESLGTYLQGIMVLPNTGYQFQSTWHKDADTTDMTTEQILADPVSADVTYTAQIVPANYTVTFYTWQPSEHTEVGTASVDYNSKIDQSDSVNKAVLEQVTDEIMRNAVLSTPN